MSSSDSESLSSDEVDYQSSNLNLKGKLLKHFNIIHELGRGTYSIVWLGYNINDSNYYAIKVQHPDDFSDGIEEIRIMKQLPKGYYLNNLIEYFIHTEMEGEKKKRYMCSVYNLHCGNLDGFVRKGEYKNGFPIESVKEFFKQIIVGLNVLHNKIKIFHGDIKPDNILLCGLNNFDIQIIDQYNEYNFKNKYKSEKKEFLLMNGRDDEDTIDSKDKLIIRSNVHKEICRKINYECGNGYKYTFNEKFLLNPKVSISDFGDFCADDEQFDEEFGTRYYRAPEILLMGECSSKVDIWAAGCCLYELLTGSILFDPEKDSKRTRDYNQLLKIYKLSGRYSKKFLKSTSNYKKIFNKKYSFRHDNPDVIGWESYLNDKGIFDKNIIDLFEKIFESNPNKRISAQEILEHKWFN